MIKNTWFKITLMFAIVLIPVLLLQFKMQKESLEMVYQMAAKMNLNQTVDHHLSTLKKAAELDPDQKKEYKKIFQKGVETKKSLQTFFLLKKQLLENLQRQSIQNALMVVTISLILALIISYTIVRRTQLLWQSKEEALQKVERLHSLENWQQIARMLIHELRHPITPIKLVNGKMLEKQKQLKPEAFLAFLEQSTRLIGDQVQEIENMIDTFATFGKLPKPKWEKVNLTDFMANFKEQYEGVFGPEIKLSTDLFKGNIQSAFFDAKLLRDLLFNLMKNAVEANPGASIHLRFKLNITPNQLQFILKNSGKTIPHELADQIFDPYLSTKAGTGSKLNMGLGLTISQKIACDHGGSLSLTSNNHQEGVEFTCQFPLYKQPPKEKV